MTLAENRIVDAERALLRAAVQWAILRDTHDALDDEIGDVTGHPDLKELQSLERKCSRSEGEVLRAARLLGGLCGSMRKVRAR